MKLTVTTFVSVDKYAGASGPEDRIAVSSTADGLCRTSTNGTATFVNEVYPCADAFLLGRRRYGMTQETMVVRTVINAPAVTAFDLLADPSTDVAIDGRGWVQQPVDGKSADRNRPDLPDGDVPRQSPQQAL